MCYPVAFAIAAAAISAAGTVAQASAARSQAKSTAKAAEEAAQADFQALQLQAQQISAKGAAEGLDIKRQAMQTKGTLVAAQADTQVTGATPLRELYNVSLKEGEALEAASSNTAGLLAQNRADMRKVQVQASNRAREAYSKVPSSALVGLQIAGGSLSAGASAYETGLRIKAGQKNAQ
jgi:hypothetical protein